MGRHLVVLARHRPRLVDFPQREYDLGLFTVDHKRKPIADVLALAASEPPTLPVARDNLTCPVDPRAPATRDRLAPGGEFHRSWIHRRQSGPVAILPPSRSSAVAS